MQSGKHSTFFSPDDVRYVLDCFRQNRRLVSDNPLCSLTAIDLLLVHQQWPRIVDLRAYVLHSILFDLCFEKLKSLRRLHGLAPPKRFKDYPSKSAALNELQQDVLKDVDLLRIWGYLYFCYMETDIGISFDDFGDVWAVTARTMRRVRDDAVQSMFDELVQLEREAIQQYIHQRNLAALPKVSSDTFVGRVTEKKRLLDALLSEDRTRILITGRPAIGKTSLVSISLHQMLDGTHPFRNIIWVYAPERIEQLATRLKHALGLHPSEVSLSDFLRASPALIVIDNFERLSSRVNSEKILTYLDSLSAKILLISDRFEQLIFDEILALGELNYNDANSLVDKALLRSNVNLRSIDDKHHHIFDLVGGHPLGLRLAANALIVGDHFLCNYDVIAQLFQSIWSSLSEKEQRTWIILAVCPEAEFDIEICLSLLSPLIDKEAITSLARRHVIELRASSSTICFVAKQARDFIRSLVKQEIVMHTFLLLAERLSATQQWYELLVEIASNVIRWGVAESSIHQLALRWLKNLDDSNIYYGDVSYQIFIEQLIKTESLSDHPLVIFAYARILRYQQDFARAIAYCAQSVERAGKAGDFVSQQLALIELASCYRSSGQLAKAQSLLNNIEQRGMLSSRCNIAFNLELAQFYIDQQMGVKALEALNEIPPSNRRGQLLKLQAALQMRQANKCIDLAQQLIEQLDTNGNRRIRGRLYAIQGQGFFIKRSYHEAIKCFTIAVNYLQSDNDLIAYGRALSSLGAAWMASGSYKDARPYLDEAKSLLSKISDPLGLAINDSNLDLIKWQFNELND